MQRDQAAWLFQRADVDDDHMIRIAVPFEEYPLRLH